MVFTLLLAVVQTFALDVVDQDRDRVPTRPVPLRRSQPVEDFPEFGLHFGILGSRDIGGLKTSGFGALVELQYNVTSRFSAALRIEGVEQFGGSIDGSTTTLDIEIKALAAYGLKGMYYLTEGPVRPFAALGFGYYAWGGEAISTTSVGIDAGSGFGVAPQLGIDLGGFRLAATYNHLFGGTDVEVTIGTKKEFSRDYLAFELSFGFSF